MKGKKAYIAFASAGVFDNDVMRHLDIVTPYVKHFLSFISITNTTIFRLEGIAIPEGTAIEKPLRILTSILSKI